jgi:hypothetical protein
MQEAYNLTGDLRDERPDDMTVDEWNQIYLEVQTELHQALAKQLIECSHNDIESSYLAY